ncbi:MAG: hypothetical protein IPM66_11375 [Acidobacteriota bacterium]|nr:MAG: hypothetical protein IPM66_11375 [Acidobacteriota bacterium]
MKPASKPALRLTADEMRRIGYRVIDEISVASSSGTSGISNGPFTSCLNI